MRVKSRVISLYILALLIILNHSVYYYMDYTKFILQISILIWTLATFIVVSSGKIAISKYARRSFGISLITAIVCFWGIHGWTELGSYLSRYMFFVPLMIMILDILKEERTFFLFALSDIIYVIAVISLIFWVLASVLHIIPSNGWIPIDWAGVMKETQKGGNNYWYIYYEVQQAPTSLIKILPYRNCGIFCEGPAYAFILSFSLLIETYFRDKTNKKRQIILWITMITTLTSSTIMYIALFLAIKWYLSDKKGRKIRTLVIPIVLFMFVCLLIVVLLNKTNQNSVMIRIGGYIGALTSLKSKPIFGYGYNFDTTYFGAGITDSLSDVIVRGGLAFTCYYLLPFIVCGIRSFKRMLKKYDILDNINFAFCLWTLYVFATTVLTYTFIMLSIVAYGYLSLIGDFGHENKENSYSVTDIK